MLKATAAALIALTLAAVIFTAWIVFPPNESSEKADVVMVIAGASDGRHELGADIVKDLGIKNFVVSNPAGSKDKKGYSHCRGEDKPDGVNAWCLDPYPVTTAGEAMTFDKLARQEGWNSVILVTNRPHSRRVNYFFNSCTDLDVNVANVRELNPRALRRQVMHEAGGFMKFWILNQCSAGR